MERFEWDPEKAEFNLRVHGVSFNTAKAIFEDPLLITRIDLELSEVRYQAIGRANGSNLLLVVHTVTYEDHEGTIVRIISARQANRRERRVYRGARPGAW
jgi:uncharacterized DUF497 family protein